MNHRRLIIITGQEGAGKSTLVRALLPHTPGGAQMSGTADYRYLRTDNGHEDITTTVGRIRSALPDIYGTAEVPGACPTNP